jgi:hypothetical protein
MKTVKNQKSDTTDNLCKQKKPLPGLYGVFKSNNLSKSQQKTRRKKSNSTFSH